MQLLDHAAVTGVDVDDRLFYEAVTAPRGAPRGPGQRRDGRPW